MNRGLGAIYKVPALIAAASLSGLLSALVTDGIWDALSWITLGSAVAIGAWFALTDDRSGKTNETAP